MGLITSKESLPESNVFANELNKFNKIINGILSSNNIFKDPEYNFFLKNRCQDFIVLNERALNKYKKYELNFLESYLLIPKTDLARTKKTYCHNISLHFTRILQLIYCVKYIYDIENNGDNSIGGIVLRNIKSNPDFIKMTVCESDQTDIRNFQKGVNFSKLSGFDAFAKYILTNHERELFIKQIQEMLGEYNKRRFQKHVCKDIIVSKEDHEKIHRSKFDCQRGGGENIYDTDIYIKVKKENPVFNWNLCAYPKRYIAKHNTQLRNAITLMRNHYKSNFSQMLEVLDKLIFFDISKQEYRLRHVSSVDLDTIEIELKRNVIVFFMQSLSDYKNILDTIRPFSLSQE